METRKQRTDELLNEIAELEDRIRSLKKSQDQGLQPAPADGKLPCYLENVLEIISIPAAIVRDGQRLYANLAYARMFGYRYLSELNGSNVLKQFAPQSREYLLDRWNGSGDAAANGPFYEVLGQRATGQYFPVSVHETGIDLPGGKALVLFISDITDKKQAEKMIRHYASFPDLDPRPILEIDLSGRVVYTNSAANKVLKDSGLEDPGIFLPADISDLLAAFQLVDHGSTYREVTIKNRIYGEDIFLASGFNTIRLYADDITGAKRSQELLRESENKYRELIEHQGEGVIVVDENEKISFVNPAGAAIFGMKYGDLLGHRLEEYLDDGQKDHLAGETDKRRQGEKGNYELEITRPDGGKVQIWVTVTPTFDDRGRFTGSLGVFRDITERKLFTEKLQKSYEQIHEVLDSTITALSTALSKRDPYTMEHQRRVTQLACAIARQMDLSPEQVEGIRVAGLLHDIGKLNIPSEILAKPERLSKTEFEIIKTHPLVGYEIIQGIKFPWPVQTIVLQHHEKLDGSGYPKGSKGNEILVESRILTVADVVEAMSSHRPYRPSLGLDSALSDIQTSAGIKYDSAVVETCVKLFTQGHFEYQ